MPKSACIGTRRPGNVAEHVAGALVTMCGASPERPTMTAFIRGQLEPAVMAICGMGPVNFAASDPSQPPVRRV